MDCCATRLRVTVKDGSKVDEGALKQSGASGVIKKGNGVQVIYGPRVTVIKSELEDYLPHAPAGPSMTVFSPAEGKAIPLSEVNDEAFAQEILGKGMAVIPSKGQILAPVSGRIENVTDSKHAVNILSDEGAQIIVHVGLDTVKLGGECFDVKVREGDHVNVGDLLLTADIEEIRKRGFDTVTPVIVCNPEDFGELKPLASGKTAAGQTLYRFSK